MGICYIVGGGDFAPELFPQKHPENFIIAADSGYTHIEKLGITPNLCIGDFDSLGAEPSGCPVIRLPSMKNETDLIAAARRGLERGYREFIFFGALGGRRFSHSEAAVQTLVWLLEQGARGEIADRNCRITALKDGVVRYPAGKRGNISVFAHSDKVTVTLEGLLYPLTRAELTNAFPLGVSNSFTGAAAAVTAEGGAVVIITEDAR